MGRKSRLKRERGVAKSANDPELATEIPAEIESSVAHESATPSRPTRARKPRPVGARVARVAVDDATWAAFKNLCGNTPASVRLGQLVAGEVERSRQPAAEQDAVAAVQAIRAHADELEAFVRAARKIAARSASLSA